MKNRYIASFEAAQIASKEVPAFRAGDTLRLGVEIKEGEKKRKDKDAYIIFPLAAAKPFRQNDAKRLANKKNIVMVSGRYEGIDERGVGWI